MPRLVTTALIVLCTALLAACSKNPPAVVEATAPAAASTPAAAEASSVPTFQDLKGKPVTLADYAGKKVFVNFWASWCAPCIREIPSIQRAAETLKGENFAFLLASDETLDVINNFLLDRNFSGNFVKLNGYVGAFGIDVMPTSALYDEHGKLLHSWQGPFEWDSADMLAQLRSPPAPQP